MKNSKVQRKIAILIPAHNEAMVLSKTLETMLKVVTKKDLYIVNDGSSDKTAQLAKRYTKFE